MLSHRIGPVDHQRRRCTIPRPANVFWDKSKGCWRSGVGGKTHYFRGIPKSDKAAARDALDRLLRELDARRVSPDDPTVAEVCERYLAHSLATAKPRTYQGHREMLIAFTEFPGPDEPTRYGLRRARLVRGADLEAMERAWKDRGLSPSYRARLVRSVKACWAWASKGDSPLLPANPIKDVPGVSVPHAPERYAERSEVAAFLRFAWRRPTTGPLYARFQRNLVLLVRLCAHTGCRPGEASAVEWRDFDAEEGTLTLDPSRHKTGGKTGRARVIYLTPPLVRALLREQCRPDRHPAYIFTHKRGRGGVERGAERSAGEPWRDKALQKRILKLREEAVAAGVPLTADGDKRFVLYKLRHTYITAAIQKGVDIKTTADLTGTSPTMIHRTYAHIQAEHLRRAAERARKRSAE